MLILPVLLVLLPSLATSRLHWTPCPIEEQHLYLNPRWPATPSTLTYNLHSLLAILSKKLYMRDIHGWMKPDKMQEMYNELRSWERKKGLIHPYPMDSLKNLWEYVTYNHFHCYPDELSLEKIFSHIIEIDARPKAANAVASGAENNPAAGNNQNNVGGEGHQNQAQQEQNQAQAEDQIPAEVLKGLDTEYSEEPEASPTFQYFSYGPAKHLITLIHIHEDELKQYLEDLAASGEHETLSTLFLDLKGQINEWSTLYYKLDTFLNAVRAFRQSLWLLRDREAKPAELKRLVQGKALRKPLKKQLAICFDRLCNSPQKPVYNE
ncbi:hypothetical protein TWF281_010999 [Arthrobotrys megalospora]